MEKFREKSKVISFLPAMADQKKAGNILSNISPPSELPSFITASTTGQPAVSQQPSSSDQEDSPRKGNETDPFISTTFSPAIPSSKDTSLSTPGPPEQASTAASGSEAKTSRDFANMILNPEPLAEALSPITQGGSALFGWMKGAVSSNGILQKVAEKAKSSVDTIVTTLDPQMKEYISKRRIVVG